jgi:hypothetical protein
MKNLIIVALLILILASCSMKPQENGLQPTFTPIVHPASSTPTNPTATIQLKTPPPSLTPRSPITIESTKTLDSAYATRESVLDSCRGGAENRLDKFSTQPYSSNNQWSAFICQDNGIYTRISNLNLGITWNVPPLDRDSSISGPEWFWEPYLWSDNGLYLYLRPKFLGYIDSPWLIYSNGFGLSRLDLETGQLTIWLGPSFDGYSFAFNQVETLFAFSPADFPDMIIIRDLVAGAEQNLSFKEKYSILEYRWTPDNSRLVIFTEERGNNQSESGFSIFVYSFRSEVLRKIVDKNRLNSSFSEEFDEPRIYMSELTNDILTLLDMYQENNFQVNIRTGELIQATNLVTATPTP